MSSPKHNVRVSALRMRVRLVVFSASVVCFVVAVTFCSDLDLSDDLSRHRVQRGLDTDRRSLHRKWLGTERRPLADGRRTELDGSKRHSLDGSEGEVFASENAVHSHERMLHYESLQNGLNDMNKLITSQRTSVNQGEYGVPSVVPKQESEMTKLLSKSSLLSNRRRVLEPSGVEDTAVRWDTSIQHPHLSNQSPYFNDISKLQQHRHLLSVTMATSDEDNTTMAMNLTTVKKEGKEYPEDLFSPAELRQGAVVLHCLGVCYMFMALAIVCDEFFVPSLEVITESYDISNDIAGATFMAAGGSMPELATSFIGIFAAHSDVGIGTIVGSAVFNILFVIGICAIVSKGVLHLTWWPLFRDVTFYSISLLLLIIVFRDAKIHWWEALVLILTYVSYVVFMKYNSNVEGFVKALLRRNTVTINSSRADGGGGGGGGMEGEPAGGHGNGTVAGHASLEPQLKGANRFRHGVLQLMIHTIDPIGEAKVHEKASKLHAIARFNVMRDTHDAANNNGTAAPAPPRGPGSANGAVKQVLVQPASNGTASPVSTVSNGQLPGGLVTTQPGGGGGGEGRDLASAGLYSRNVSQQTTVTTVTIGSGESSGANSPHHHMLAPASQAPGGAEPTAEVVIDDMEDLDGSEPLDLSWPETWRKRAVYVVIAPIMFLLWACLPDVRRPERRRWYPVTFLGSITFIGAFSYLMNWWAAVISETLHVPEAITGLTVLAAGTSIPDLITSVIVAKKGFGDMAVSSSVGSNIFDVTIGLPLPWFIYGLAYGHHYNVDTAGLLCAIIMLFCMLLGIIGLIAAFGWRMTKTMGASMLGMYGAFLAVSLLLTYDVIPCVQI